MGWWGQYVGSKPTMSEIRSVIYKDVKATVVGVKFGYAICVVLQEDIDNNVWDKSLLGMIIIAMYRYSSGELMIKQVSESMGPCYYEIPMKWLKVKPEGVSFGKFSDDYREKVIEVNKHASKIRKLVKDLKAGNIIVTKSNRYKFQEFIGRKGTMPVGIKVNEDNKIIGGRYRIPQSYIQEVEIAGE